MQSKWIKAILLTALMFSFFAGVTPARAMTKNQQDLLDCVNGQYKIRQSRECLRTAKWDDEASHQLIHEICYVSPAFKNSEAKRFRCIEDGLRFMAAYAKGKTDSTNFQFGLAEAVNSQNKSYETRTISGVEVKCPQFELGSNAGSYLVEKHPETRELRDCLVKAGTVYGAVVEGPEGVDLDRTDRESMSCFTQDLARDLSTYPGFSGYSFSGEAAAMIRLDAPRSCTSKNGSQARLIKFMSARDAIKTQITKELDKSNWEKGKAFTKAEKARMKSSESSDRVPARPNGSVR